MNPQEAAMPQQKEYNITTYVPGNAADAFSTVAYQTVSGLFWQIYGNALVLTNQEEGERIAVNIRLEKYPLGAFILPFEKKEETPEMHRMTVAEFYELLYQDWPQAFRILPVNAHSQVDAFLAM